MSALIEMLVVFKNVLILLDHITVAAIVDMSYFLTNIIAVVNKHDVTK